MQSLAVVFAFLAAVQTPSNSLVDGLKSNESVRELGADVKVEAGGDQRMRSRLLDAQTGEPLANVRVEFFHEDELEGPAIFLGEVATASDGTYDAPHLFERKLADKTRLSKAGYESTEFGGGPDDEVFLYKARPIEGRILDLEGQPIEGVVIRSRQSCAHAPPASESRTDADGRFQLATPPSLLHIEEFEIIAERHAPIAIDDLMGWELIEQRALRGSLEWRLPRRLPFELRVLDVDGNPARNCPVTSMVAPQFWLSTDSDGRVRIPPMALGRVQRFALAANGSRQVLSPTSFPERGVIAVAPELAKDAQVSSRTAHVSVRVRVDPDSKDPAANLPTVRIFDSRGHMSLAREADLPLGPTRVMVGFAFHEFEERSIEFELGAESKTIELTTRCSPRIIAFLPAGTWQQFHVQAGDDSISSTEVSSSEKERVELFAPSEQPIRIWIANFRGAARMVSLGPLAPGSITEAHLERDDAIVRPTIERSTLATCHLRFKCAAGTHVSIFNGLANEVGADVDSSGIATVDVASGSEYCARFDANDCLPTWLIGRAACNEAGLVAPIRIQQHRRAHLELAGDVASVVAIGAELETADGVVKLTAAPGPLTLRIARKSKSPLELALQLGDGEARRITVP